MKVKSLWLIVFAFAVTTAARAQEKPMPVHVNSKALAQMASAEAKDFKLSRSKAMELAKKNDWVIEKVLADGTYMSLQGLDSRGMPIYYITHNNTRAAATTKTDQLWLGGSAGLNLSGAGASVTQKMAVWDGGSVRGTHQELAGRVEQKDSPKEQSEHATHVAGTMIASGVNPLAKGMAFGFKKLFAYDFNSDLAEMAAAAPNLLVSNHSYGSLSGWHYNSDRKGTDEDPYWEWWGDTEISGTEDYKFGYYDNTASKWDQVAYNAPYYLIVKSAGNSRNEAGPEVGKPYFQRDKAGKFTLVKSRPNNINSNNSYDIIATYGTAKNILSVGAVAAISGGYNKPADVQITSFSSYGPTDDGRIKPDIVGNGASVLSSSSESNRAYSTSSGTSMAAPNVAGTLLLLQEHYSNLNSGNVMRAATLKGLAIHTADEAGAHAGPDYIYGWGLLNAERAAAVITNARRTHLLQERTLTDKQVYTFDVVASGTGPLVVTISWTDPEASPIAVSSSALNNRTPRLVNDLDVRVAHGSTTFMPWILDPAKPDQAASRGDNKLDNVEQVLLPNAVPGEKYTITVSHKGTLSKGPQAYALLVSGVGGKAYCTSTGTATTGAKINRLVFGGTTVNAPATCATYRNLTQHIFSLEAGETKSLSLQVGTCGADATKIAKVFIDWNGDGDFNDAGEEVAASGAISSTGTFTASVTAPATLRPGDKTRMRIVLEETGEPDKVSSCGTVGRGETQDYLIEYIQPQKDVGVAAVMASGAALCATPSQSIVVRLRNFGTTAQAAIPVTVSVRKGGVEVAQLTGLYNGRLEAFREDELLLSSTFATEANTAYELVAVTNLPGDVVAGNNSRSVSFTVTGEVEPPQATVFSCGSEGFSTLSGTGNGTIFWFDSPTAPRPFAAGNQLQLPSNQVGNTVYAALNDFSGQLGPKGKNFASDGGYNQFSPDVLVTSNGGMVLESARLYIGNSGRITFTVFDQDGSPVSSRTLNVTATRTTPAPNAQPNDPADPGEVYYLGLVLPEAGDYRIAIAYEDGATIFRNNVGVTGYPFEIPNVISIKGNTATTTPESYYYYFYDLQVRARGCKSERVAVTLQVGAPLEKPAVSRDGQTLKSSSSTGNRWFLDGRPIEGATGATFTPTESGSYSVQVVRDGCISEMSVAYAFDYKPGIRELGTDLVVSPNPSTGRFRVELETSEHQDIMLEVTDLLGKVVYREKVENYYGQYNGFIDLDTLASGVYMLRVQHGDSIQTKKLLLRR